VIRLLLAVLVLSLLPCRATAHPELLAQIDAVTTQIQQQPTEGHLYLLRAQLYSMHADHDAALRDTQAAADAGTTEPDVLLVRGRVLGAAGRPGDAADALAGLTNRYPAISAGHLARADLLTSQGQFAAAADAYTSAISTAREPRPETYLARARALENISSGTLDAAIRSLDDGIARLGPVATLQLEAIRLEEQLGNVTGAATRMRALAEKANRPEMYLMALAEMYARTGNSLEAAAAAEKVRSAISQLPPLAQAQPTTRALLDRLNRLNVSPRNDNDTSTSRPAGGSHP